MSDITNVPPEPGPLDVLITSNVVAVTNASDWSYDRAEKHRAIFEVDVYTLVTMLRPGRRQYRIVENALPVGATVYGVEFDHLRQIWKIGLEHPSFPVCGEGAIPVTLDTVVMFTELLDDDGGES